MGNCRLFGLIAPIVKLMGGLFMANEMGRVPYTIRDLTLECEFEFEAGEPRTWDEPGCPDQYTLTGAFLNGVDIVDILDPALIEQLEERAGWP